MNTLLSAKYIGITNSCYTNGETYEILFTYEGYPTVMVSMNQGKIIFYNGMGDFFDNWGECSKVLLNNLSSETPHAV